MSIIDTNNLIIRKKFVILHAVWNKYQLKTKKVDSNV